MSDLWTKYADEVKGMRSVGTSNDEIWIHINNFEIMEKARQERENKTKKQKENTITIINCENCQYDKCEFYNKSGNSWCPRCKGVNYHK